MATKYRGKWHVDFYWTHRTDDRFGEVERFRFKSPIQTKKDTQLYEDQLKRRLLDGKPLKVSDDVVPLFRDFADEFMQTYALAHNKQSEQDTKDSMLRCHLRPRFDKVRLDAISTHDIEKMRAEMRTAGISAKRINNVTGCLLKILRYAHEREIIEKLPKIRPLKTKPPKFDFFTFDEYARLVEAARSDVQMLAMIRLAAEAGLRKGEIPPFARVDVDFDRSALTVSRNSWFRKSKEHVGPPKGGRDRMIDMTTTLAEALAAVPRVRLDRLFHRTGDIWTPKTMELALKEVCRRAELRPVGWHVLRHTFCSHLAMSGVDAPTIQRWAGHTTLTMTMRYMHLSPAHTRDAIRRLEIAHRERGNTVGTRAEACSATA